MLSYAFALLFSMFSFQFEELLKHFCKAGLEVMSYLSFCLSGKDSISPPFLEDNFAGIIFLVGRVFSFRYFEHIIALFPCLQDLG